LTVAHRIYERFLTRVEERLKQIEEVLKLEHDFAVDEEMVRDPDAATYPKSQEEAFERWRKRIKFDLLDLAAEEVEKEEATDRLRRRYTNFAKRMEQMQNEDLSEMFLSAVTTVFDPHSTYMSPSTLENFWIIMGLELEGIGASLTVEDGYTVLKKIIPGGAADEDGRLKVEDKIIGVGDGTGAEIVDVVDMRLNDVVKKIRGKAGTVVRLEVIAADGTGKHIYDIERARIELKDQEARSEVIEFGQKPSGGPYKIGVLDLPSFYMDMEGAQRGEEDFKSATRDMRRLLEKFNAEGVDLVVVDLRRNGGGSLTEAINMTGLFIDKGPVVLVKGPDGEVQPYHDHEEGQVCAQPLVVLTSKFSASASEIFAGAIQDYNRGIVVGDKSTHGKGTVQQLFDIARVLFRLQETPPVQLGALKLTIQQFYLPNGDSTQYRGVLSDIELPSITTHFPIGEGDLDYALPFDRVRGVSHQDYKLINEDMIESLKKASEQRRQESEGFARELTRIDRYIEQRDRTTRTLNLEKFLAERKELNVEEEEEKLLDETDEADRPVFDREDYYNQEVLSIAEDYLRLLQANGHTIAQKAPSSPQGQP
jgi:carboxyl-terminal processing protease